jgi:hypothetical protein
MELVNKATTLVSDRQLTLKRLRLLLYCREVCCWFHDLSLDEHGFLYDYRHITKWFSRQNAASPAQIQPPAEKLFKYERRKPKGHIFNVQFHLIVSPYLHRRVIPISLRRSPLHIGSISSPPDPTSSCDEFIICRREAEQRMIDRSWEASREVADKGDAAGRFAAKGEATTAGKEEGLFPITLETSVKTKYSHT